MRSRFKGALHRTVSYHGMRQACHHTKACSNHLYLLYSAECSVVPMDDGSMPCMFHVHDNLPDDRFPRA
jgi:hypothetical protein